MRIVEAQTFCISNSEQFPAHLLEFLLKLRVVIVKDILQETLEGLHILMFMFVFVFMLILPLS